MNRTLYPKNWNKISFSVKDNAGWICEKCGKQCRKPGEPFDTHKRTLTTAHLDHNPQNCNKDNLKEYCAPCHLRYDAQHHAETRKKKKEGNDYNDVGYIFEDFDWEDIEAWAELPSVEVEK